MILFLLISRNHNRYRNQDGFVDSTRRVRALNRQQDQLFVSRSVKTPTRSGLLAGINRVASPSTLPTTHNNSKFSSNQENETGQNSNILEIKRKDYDKQMRLIEVFFFCFFSNRSLTFFSSLISVQEQMIKAKQEEREAKRLENDIKKEQRMIRHSFRDLDVGKKSKKTVFLEFSSDFSPRHDEETLSSRKTSVEKSPWKRQNRTRFRQNQRKS